jgi:DNA invertase Pin-like site-specific DNA recombinase
LENHEKPKAYSYLRFSTPEQAAGTSFERQISLAKKYADEHGLDLVDRQSFYDLGISSFRGQNLKTGALGTLFDLAQDGTIKSGSYLLVESFDRISRENAYDSLFVLKELCELGITIVTIFDNQIYNSERFRKDASALFIAIGILQRSHDESKSKSNRGLETWEIKRKKAVDNKTPLTSILPNWLRLDKEKKEIVTIPERVKIIQNIFDDYEKGIGYSTIAKNLTQSNEKSWKNGNDEWQRTYISKILKNPAVIGTHTAYSMQHEKGKTSRLPRETIDDFFPAIISKKQFYNVRAMLDSKNSKTSSARQFLLHNLAKCPQCGSTLTRKSHGQSPKSGKPSLVCTKKTMGGNCDFKSIKLHLVEDYIISELPNVLRRMPKAWPTLLRKFEQSKNELANIDQKIDNLVKALSEEYSSAIANKIRELENDRIILIEESKKAGISVDSQTDEILEVRKLEVIEYFENYDSNNMHANAQLRKILNAVVVDHDYLTFKWKHHVFSECIKPTFGYIIPDKNS